MNFDEKISTKFFPINEYYIIFSPILNVYAGKQLTEIIMQYSIKTHNFFKK